MTTKFQIGDRVVTQDGSVGTVLANTVSAEGVDVLVKMKMRCSFSEQKLRFADETTVGKFQAALRHMADAEAANKAAAAMKAKPAKRRSR